MLPQQTILFAILFMQPSSHLYTTIFKQTILFTTIFKVAMLQIPVSSPLHMSISFPSSIHYIPA